MRLHELHARYVTANDGADSMNVNNFSSPRKLYPDIRKTHERRSHKNVTSLNGIIFRSDEKNCAENESVLTISDLACKIPIGMMIVAKQNPSFKLQ